MRGVDAAFERLQPVALFPHLRHVAVGFRHLRPFEGRRRRHLVARPHIGPDRPRRSRSSDRRSGGPCDRTAPARSSARRNCLRRRISSRDRCSAGRIPRCARTTARRGDAGKTRRPARCVPGCRERRRASRRAAARAPAGSPPPAVRATSRPESNTAATHRPSACPVLPASPARSLRASALWFLSSNLRPDRDNPPIDRRGQERADTRACAVRGVLVRSADRGAKRGKR